MASPPGNRKGLPFGRPPCLPLISEVLRLASRTRCEPRHRGDRHRRDKGESHEKPAYGRASRAVKPADALCTAATTCLRRGAFGWPQTCLVRWRGEIHTVRPLVLFALIASVACTASPRAPEAAATLVPLLAPVRGLPAIASPEPLPAITVPPLVTPLITAPLPNAVPLPAAVPLPTAVPIPTTVQVPTVAPLRIASPRPLSTIPAIIRPAAPIPTPGLLPLPTSLPILPIGP